MCGQLGVIFENGERNREQIAHLTDVFTKLLLVSERRGFHATGVGWVNRVGEHQVNKQPVPAHEFVQYPAFDDVLSQVDNRTTILMGHTRWKTQGTQYDNANNHPQIGRFCQGTHNGHISNADYLFRHFNLPRRAVVDSEIIFRIADSAIVERCIDTNLLSSRLSLCRGQMSAVLVSWLDPETVVIVKGDKPMEFRYHRKHKAMIYASEARFIDFSMHGENGWSDVPVPPMSLVVFNTNRLTAYRQEKFEFGQDAASFID